MRADERERARANDQAAREVEAAPELEGMAGGVETAEPAASRWSPGGFSPGVRYMALGAFSFSVMSLLVKQAGERLPSQEIVLARAVITLLLSWWAVRRAGVGLWGTERKLLLFRGVVGFLALACFYHSVVHLPLADATVIQYTNPVFAAILAAAVLGERVRRREALSVLVSLVGVVMVTRPSFLFGAAAQRIQPLDVGIGLAGAVFSAVAYVTIRRLRAEHPMVIVFYFTLVSVIGSLPAAFHDAVWPTPVEWLILLGVGVTTQIGQVSLTRGLRLERAGKATAVAYLQVVFAALWGALFFAEIPDAGTLLGTALVIGSTLVVARPAREPTAKSSWRL